MKQKTKRQIFNIGLHHPGILKECYQGWSEMEVNIVREDRDQQKHAVISRANLRLC
jgi:hypothetical protein